MEQLLYPAQWLEGHSRRVGYIDGTGSICLTVAADAAFGFNEGRARIKRGGKIGVIDAAGNLVLDCILASAFDYRFGWSVASVDGVSRGLLDREGRWGLEPAPREVSSVSAELYCSKELGEDGWYLRNFRGESYAGPFPFRTEALSCGRIRVFEGSGRYRYVGVDGEQVIDREFPAAFDFSEDLALVCLGQRWCYIDVGGVPKISCVDFQEFPDGSCFHQGLAPVGCLNTRSGIDYFYINTGGRITIGPYGGTKEFSAHGAAACKAGTDKWGLIDREGRWIAKPEWLLVDSFSGDLARAFREAPIRGKAHYLDSAGRVVWVDGERK